MRARLLLLVLACGLVPQIALAQGTPTGTISGRVASGDGLPLPGVTVTATATVLQGERIAVTTGNGDFLLAFLPPGAYVVSFALDGFRTVQQRTAVAAAEVARISLTLEPASVTETVVVVGARTDVIKQTATAATTMSQRVVDDLPLNRGIDATVALTPGAVRAGPSGSTGVQPISISGASSFENLVLVNGVSIQDNIRRTTDGTLFIEDALQETTISTSSVSAEFGRFNGGVVNAITKSGGNRVDGTFRLSFENDDWRARTPFQGDSTTSKVIPIYEYTVGGPVLRDRLWFFHAGRTVERTEARTTAAPARLPYERIRDEKRFEGKLTYTPFTGHTVKGAYMWTEIASINDNFADELDLQSLTNRTDPGELRSLNYTGVLGGNLFLEGQYSARATAIEGAGAKSQDLIDGTLLIDGVSNGRFHSATFCGVCRPEERDNEGVIVKASYFLSTSRLGSHQVIGGYDGFNDKRAADAHQSGSGYRIIATSSIWREGQVYPVFNNVGSSTLIRWNPIFNPTQGTNFRTHAVFLNDVWQVNSRLTVNLGLRYDWNDGVDSSGAKVVDDARWSPRLSASWDPTGSGTWTVNGSYATYVAGIANAIANLGSNAGGSARFDYQYLGPAVNTNPDAPLLTSSQALGVLFDWFQANGGTNRPTVVAAVPGVNTRIASGLRSPAVNEVAGGVTRRLGARGLLRVDGVFRDFQDFYATRADTTTGQVTNQLGQVFDVRVIENTNARERRYAGLNIAGSWRGGGLFVGGGYTLSRAWGSVDGENVASGPTTVGPLFYPEFIEQAWNEPEGDLATDQRHKARLFATYTTPSNRWGGVTLGVIQALSSGLTYNAIGTVNSGRYLTNPGYRQPPATVNYYFSDRDGFRTAAWYSTDVAATYTYRLPVSGGRQADLFVKGEVLNLLNLDGLVVPRFINQGVLTNVNRPAAYAAFNPFTETPVEGTHWALDPSFGTATSRFGYQVPRTFRMSVGVRF